MQEVAAQLPHARDPVAVEAYWKAMLAADGDSGRGKPSHPRTPNKHGRRLNPRKGIPMHIMATYALMRLSDHQGNLSDMAAKIQENKFFSDQLDWTPRPGTKTYPRYDLLLPSTACHSCCCPGTCLACANWAHGPCS